MFDPTQDAIDFYESLEGMLVTINDAQAVDVTDGGATWVVPNGGANATGLNDRGGLTISDGDFNPERVQVFVDAGVLPGFTGSYDMGDQLGDVIGVEEIQDADGAGPGETATASFTYVMKDAAGATSAATVQVMINGPPTARRRTAATVRTRGHGRGRAAFRRQRDRRPARRRRRRQPGRRQRRGRPAGRRRHRQPLGRRWRRHAVGRARERDAVGRPGS